MKKLLAALLCLLIGLVPVQALASEYNVLIPRTDDGIMDMSVTSSCAIGDTLYMMCDYEEMLVVHKLGDKQPAFFPLEGYPSAGYDVSKNMYLIGGEQLMMLSVVVDYNIVPNNCTAKMYGIEVDGDKALLTELYDVDWEFMRSEDGGYFNYIDHVYALKNEMLFSCWNDVGDRQFYIMSYADGARRDAHIADAVSIVPYTGDRLLVQQFNYENPTELRFALYDPATDVTEPLSSFAVEEYSLIPGLACNTETGEVYCAENGEIFPLDIMTGERGEAVSDMPFGLYSESTAYVLPGNYFAYASYEGYVLRCLDKDQPEKRTLRICDTAYAAVSEQAFFDFSNRHGDVTAIFTHDFDIRNMIDYMMSQDDTMDVYIMYASIDSFDAVFNRGYIAPFDSDVMREAASKIEPAVLERLSVDGEFAVLPLDMYFWLPQVNPTALAKLGLTVEDVPANWDEFLDFLLMLQDIMPQDGSVRLLDPYTSTHYARYSLFNAIFETYQIALRQDPNSVSRQQMTDILNKLDKIDFSRLGQPSEDEIMSEDYYPEWNNDEYLFQFSAGGTVQGVSRSGYCMVMTMLPDMPAYLSVETTVAFINPFSKNKDLAVDYIEILWEKLGDDTMYCIRTDKTEPTKNTYHEENVAWWEEYIEELKVRLSEADPMDIQMLEEEIAGAEEAYEEAKLDIWAITEEDVAWITEHRSEIVLNGGNWLYSDESGEAYDLADRYIQGLMSAEQFMREVDGKIRMMLMEGY